MAGKPDGGLREALALDQAADDLNKGRAGGSENPDPAAEQLALFSGSSVFGTIRSPDGNVRTGGPGRPRGSINRTTRDLVKLIESTGRHPLLAMAEIVATPIDVIASTLGCKRIEAAEYHRKVMSDLAPYVAQKLPTMIQPVGANAGMFTVLDLRALAALAEGGSEFALAMKLVDAQQDPAPTIEHQQNQTLSDDDEAAPHDATPHEGGK